ncbi:hypothetical protein F9B85_03395 [Heliorestis acidaminivorans]|uniref:Uncharacterized protein n=1 Tax=Heliorestis acidaminivorans TaxID=553427 RepID=A0A6I0F4R8_9FIRM|nr:hypothetical protein [Heliorestis acidaminivorans]KAB2953677.1 hypothetical protein F9B85_03395 [Heliorestis acidaminivorans]
MTLEMMKSKAGKMAGMLVVATITVSLLAGCGKSSQNEVATVTIPAEQINTLSKQESYTVEPFKVTVGGYNAETKSTPFEIINATDDVISDVAIVVLSNDPSIKLTTDDDSIGLTEDGLGAVVGYLGPKRNRILAVENVPKDQFELYLFYGEDKTQLRIYPE